jgi:hypothetical protein
MNMKRIAMSAACLLSAAAAMGASADVLFSNFGEGDAYLADTGWSVANDGPFGADIDEAVRISISGGDSSLDSVEMGIGHLFGPNILFIDLLTDEGGGPGTVIESTTIEDVGTFGQQNPPEVAVFSGTTILESGESYWISASTVSDTDAWFAWNYNIVEDRGIRAWRQDLGQWNVFSGDPRGTFRVNGTPLPAPGMIAVLGLAGLSARRRRR